jgi:Flp pilus assembly protein CpaB
VSSDARAVLVANRDLVAGATIGAEDLGVARVRVDDAIYQAVLPAEALADLVGKQLAEPVHAHELLPRAALSSRPALAPEQMALTIAISPESAVGGKVRAGNLVQVLLTTNKGKPEAKTSVVLPQATVYDVGHEQRLAVVNASTAGDTAAAPSPQGPVKWLTLVVSQEQALRLAQAKWSGELDVALLPAGQP